MNKFSMALIVAALLLLSLACGSSRAEWILTEEPSADVLHLKIAVAGGCSVIDHIDVDELPDLVKIEAYTRTDGSDCEDIMQLERQEVQLDMPLGDRRLVGCTVSGRDYLRTSGPIDCRDVQR